MIAVALTACAQGKASGTTRRRRDAREFGAVGDGQTNDAPAFQRAINAVAQAGGGIVSFGPGTYLLRYRQAEDGDGLEALTLRSGVMLEGTDRDRCVLKLADSQLGTGTYARTISSRGEIAGAQLRRFTIDGNREGQGSFRDDINGGVVLLGWKGRCVDVVVEDLRVRGAVGQGIMLLGTIGNPSRNLHIADNQIEHSSYIGIQCSQFDGVRIVNNRISDCHDNGIDIYGDDTNNQSPVSTSHRATIAGNRVQRCSIGVFLETVADCVAENNIIVDCRSAGVRINRIHGEPRNLTVAHNRISGTPIGVAMGGETGGVVIRNNVVLGFDRAGIDFQYNVSHVSATGNRFVPAGAATPIVLATPTRLDTTPAEMLSDIRIQHNSVPTGHDPHRLFVSTYRRLSGVEVN